MKKITKNYSKKSLTNYKVKLEILNPNNKLDILKKILSFARSVQSQFYLETVPV